ncbi:MAG: DUF484 family protein [Silicimonas sp.]|jgi:hypothetical protein|nr:DUF484 family protein [Silicimonas sp.]
MSEQAAIAEELRMRILQEPDVILEDPDVMRALIAANDRASGGNVIDLRGVAMDRLEERLQRLEETHRSVIAAAYENMAGMTQVHRAVLAFLEPLTFEAFLASLEDVLPQILRVGRVRLVIESHEAADPALDKVGGVLTVVQPGFVSDYMSRGRTLPRVALRQTDGNAALVYGSDAAWVKSEACLYLDFGEGRLPGMLCFASDNPVQFQPNQGTDLLDFMGGAFERAMCRWLG